jgi:tartrate dehydratase alpha subunit/fumarate hydratase class I-like protein
MIMEEPMDRFYESMRDLVVQTSTNLPADVRAVLAGALVH